MALPRRSAPATLIALALLGLVASGCAPLSQFYDLRSLRPLTRAERFYREGERLAAEGKVSESLLAYRQATTADPGYVPAQRRLAAAYEAQGRRRLAAYFYERVLERTPQDRDTRLALLAVYDALGQADRANDLRLTLGTDAPPASASGPQAGPRLLWSTTLEEQAISGLGVGPSALYAATQGGNLYALDRATAQMLWRVTAPKPIVSTPLYSPDPALPLVFFGAEDGMLYAVSPSDGHEVWHFRAQAPVYGTAAVGGDTVYFGSVDGNLYAAQRSSGDLLWKFTTQDAVHAGPLVAGDTVYVGSLDGNLYALDAGTGQERWRFAAAAAVESTPAVVGERLYFGANDSRLYCLDVRDGSELWEFSTGDSIYARPVLGERDVFLASASHALYGLTLDKGTEFWRFEAESFLTTTPAYDGQVLYFVAASDPRLYAVEAAHGREVWTLDTGDWPSTEPLLSGRVLYLGEKDGTILAYQLP